MNFRAIKGMNDILPGEVERWQQFERAFRDTVELFGYREIRTPIVEPTSLFVRSIGEATDIVEKEMYSFTHHDDALTLRPEGTAGAVRAFVEHHIDQREPVTRWYYLGPMFRGERPARGRYRQFYQVGCELMGDPGPASDAEMIDMLVRFFQRLGIGQLEVVVNSLGGPATRPRYKQALVEHLTPRASQLSEDSQRRLTTNPLRILDSKDERDIAAIAGAPSVIDLLDDEDRAHWQKILTYLERLGTPYRADPQLVRGLDYYSRTLFEVRSSAGLVGAQNALGGGGRYDGLAAEIGGPATPSIGFALGIERILLAMGDQTAAPRPIVMIAPIGERASSEALVLAREIRDLGVAVDVDTRGTSLRAMLRRANALGAPLCVVIGDSEVDAAQVQLKDLAGHNQSVVARADAATQVASLLKAASAGGSG
ncbi:MAG: histidine--tRNA ligase [Deltaproteobacteria bacterium]|nr:histidine--tRNA ligase [Deltaproteobacteria bacterium]